MYNHVTTMCFKGSGLLMGNVKETTRKSTYRIAVMIWFVARRIKIIACFSFYFVTQTYPELCHLVTFLNFLNCIEPNVYFPNSCSLKQTENEALNHCWFIFMMLCW